MATRATDQTTAIALPHLTAPTVTVAIACYNQARFLSDAIASVLAQTRSADGIIVVDDGSNDATPAVAARYPRVFYHWQANAGLSAARNAGLRLARTSHILFLDADDLLMPTALASALDRIAECPDAALVYGGYREVDVDRKPTGDWHAVAPSDSFCALLHDNFIGMHGTVLYDTARLRAIGGFEPTLKSCEDWDAYLRLARHYPIAAYVGLAAEYRRHGAGLSTNMAQMLAMTRRVLDRQRALGLTPEQERAARGGLAFARRDLSLRLIGRLKRDRTSALAVLRVGLSNDRLFPVRLLGAICRRLVGWRRPARR